MSVLGTGYIDKALTHQQMRETIAAGAQEIRPEGKSILVIIPDHTRTCPLGEIARELHAVLGGSAKRLDFLIALGTHPPMSEEMIDELLGVEAGKRGEVFGNSKVFNHTWNDPAALEKVGTLKSDLIERITEGRFAMDIDVTINKLIFDYDIVLITGPVFPHEVAGFSGGSKYFFPGICGEQLLNFFHWVGAVITNPRIIGTRDTPVRAILEAAADMLKIEAFALCMVVKGEDLCGLYFGPVREAWSAAADLSAKVHIIYVDKPFESVLSRAPLMYEDIWTGGKCMYKMEPIVADAGELIIYAPHITEISYTHGEVIRQIGYHTRDYFLAQWDRFKDYPWGVVAHSTHVRGIGTMDGDVEKPRIDVTLATGIAREVCEQVNLGYRDPESIDISHWEGHEADGRLYVPKAGEMLYRLKDPPEWQKSEG